MAFTVIHDYFCRDVESYKRKVLNTSAPTAMRVCTDMALR